MTKLSGFLSLAFLAACGGAPGSAETSTQKTGGETPQQKQQPVSKTAAGDASSSSAHNTTSQRANTARDDKTGDGAILDGRTRRVSNPDGLVMVLLYHQLAGLTPPVNDWVEKDRRVSEAPPVKKPEMRKTIAAEIAAADAAVKDIGAIRITTNTQLSEYDPTYEEYLVSALDPASMFTFTSNEQTVRLKFSNADDAQIWRVPADAYQAIEDRIQYRGALTLTIDAEIETTQPGVKGGDIIARITGYVLENNFNNGLIARVAVEGASDR